MRLLISVLLTVTVVTSECPAGSEYLISLNKCVMLVNSVEIGFTQAEANCQSKGGHLISIHHGFENAAIKEFANEKNFFGNAYIGANLSNGPMHWTDGTDNTYTNWAVKQPIASECTVMQTSDGQWYSVNCYLPVYSAYFCELPETGPAGLTCLHGWTLFNESCYMFVETYPKSHDWDASREYCVGAGGDLASIHSSHENNFLTSFVQPKTCWVTAIGLTYNNGYSWSDGTPITFLNATNTDYDSPPYAYFLYPACYRSPQVGCWQDWSTLDKVYSFICKQRAIPCIGC